MFVYFSFTDQRLGLPAKDIYFIPIPLNLKSFPSFTFSTQMTMAAQYDRDRSYSRHNDGDRPFRGNRYGNRDRDFGMAGGRDKRLRGQQQYSKSDEADKWSHDLFDKQGKKFNNRNRDFDNDSRSHRDASKSELYGKKVMVENLHWRVTESDLKELFDEYNCEQVVIKYDRTDRSTGVAELSFKTKEDAQSAMERYNSVELDGQPMQLRLWEPPRFSAAPSSAVGGRSRDIESRLSGGGFGRGGSRDYAPRRRYDDRPYARQGSSFRGDGHSRPRRGGGPRSNNDRPDVKDSKKSAEQLDREMEEYMKSVEKPKDEIVPNTEIPSIAADELSTAVMQEGEAMALD
ncbi:hypothetical protein BKA69DRAFT_1078252 [Paraphysoderma sedebokerense]|nr:hypothetical protein BKA69DRAFT_1078252 [Paraphysoderma sedebokerense]